MLGPPPKRARRSPRSISAKVGWRRRHAGSSRSVAQLEQGKPSAELAAALAQLGRVRVLAGHSEAAAAPLERALTLAERLLLPEVFVEALTSRAVGV